MPLRSTTRRHGVAALLLVVTTASAASVAAAGPDRAADTPDDTVATGATAAASNGRIAYVASGPSTRPDGGPDRTDIWMMNADGTGRTNLTRTGDIDETEPAWSPDGRSIAYIAGPNRRLTIISADGLGTHSIFDDLASPSWSPDGLSLAALWSDGTDTYVFDLDLWTGSHRILADADLEPAMEPVWGPSGALVVVSSRSEWYRDPVTGELVEGEQNEIVVDTPTGFGDDVVVSAGTPGSERATTLEDDRAPAWSPDGSMLVFMSHLQTSPCCPPWQLWAVNRDGTGLTKLSADDTLSDMYPAWSPDGARIVFTRATDGGDDLYTIPAPDVLPLQVPTTFAATPLTTDGNATDASWGRRPERPIRLVVGVAGVGGATGRVVSTPPGIRCGTDCADRFTPGSTVTLHAIRRAGSRFVRWSGACSGTDPICDVTLDEASRVTAHFRAR